MTVHQARGYQTSLIHRVEACWAAGQKNVMPVLATGGGKTMVVASLVERRRVPTVSIAHRAELVSQMSVALAREGIRHRVIGPEAVRRNCVQAHLEEFGRTYYDPTSCNAVAGVDTLVRMDPNDPFFASIGLWVTDEGHHLLLDNKWGRAVAMFPNAYGLAPTATPRRADGKGLGRHADGVIDVLVEAPGARELIEDGYLTDYDCYVPPSDLDLANVQISAGGDFNPDQLRAARRKSKLTGDVVEHYCRLAWGKLGVTFDTDLTSALETMKAFRAAGVPAEVLSGETPAAQRSSILRRFKNREIWQIVSVDVISEGFDLPAIEVVSFARATQSFSLFAQQLGRALRLMISRELMAQWERFTPEQRKAHIAASGKPKAIVIDHVGNILRHGPPDRPQVWSLDRRERRSRSAPDDAIPLRSCVNPACNRPYERIKPACPYCGDVPVPADRSKPEFVDGELALLDPTLLAALRGEADRIMRAPLVPTALRGSPAGQNVVNTHNERLLAQRELRRLMALWGGARTLEGCSDEEIQRRFFYAFGRLDVLTAQTLGAREANELAERIATALKQENVAI